MQSPAKNELPLSRPIPQGTLLHRLLVLLAEAVSHRLRSTASEDACTDDANDSELHAEQKRVI